MTDQIEVFTHSSIRIKDDSRTIYVDPYKIREDYKDADYIFVTHGHSDHLGSSIEISKKTGAPITSVFELANYCSMHGVRTNGCGLGAWKDYDWGKVILVPAFHSSSTPDGKYAGCPCGFIFEIEGAIVSL